MAKNWQNLGFAGKFLMQFALFDEQKNGIFGSKILWSLSITG